MTQQPIAVVGAAGLSGTILLSALRDADIAARAVVHDDAGAERARAAGAHAVVQAELADPDSIRAALESASHVYMIPPAMTEGEDVFAINALKAAEQVGARRFVYVSVLHPHSPGMPHHLRKERAELAVRHSSISWTILQPAIYAQMLYGMFAKAPAGPVGVPFNVDHVFSIVDLRDLAEVAVKTLTEEEHDYATYELCGPSLTLAEMGKIAGTVRGVALEPVRIAPSEAPMPPRYADKPSARKDLVAMWEDYDQHGLRGNMTVLTALLGRPPRSFADVVRSLQPGQ